MPRCATGECSPFRFCFRRRLCVPVAHVPSSGYGLDTFLVCCQVCTSTLQCSLCLSFDFSLKDVLGGTKKVLNMQWTRVGSQDNAGQGVCLEDRKVKQVMD